MKPIFVTGLIWALAATLPASGQLAITELMSSAAITDGAASVTNGPDFWELTNFGNTPIDLAGYYFTDSANQPEVKLVQSGDPQLVIQPGESIVFVRTDVTTRFTTETEFRDWWGASLGPAVQVRMMPRTPGFDQTADSLRLYGPAGQLLHRVDIGVARRGVSFTYDTNTGVFGVFSALDQCGAGRAALADDIGSPGAACGPVPLRILSAPASQEVCAGIDATFQVWAESVPPPRYQWLFDGVPMDGATTPVLMLTNVTAQSAGSYAVEVTDGFSTLRSAAGNLSVTTDPSAPAFVSLPQSPTVIIGQTARFSVKLCASPPPAYQWLSNGVPLSGATGPELVLEGCPLSWSGAEFCLRAQNSLGTTSACARLTVISRPRLEITEMMPAPAPDCGHEDWFEITNRGTNAVNLLGYRFSDRFTLDGAHVILAPIVLAPGGSVIVVERLTAAQFVDWWGAERLPPGLPIITFVGGNSFSSFGDELYLWSASAGDAFDPLAAVAYASALEGISLEFDATRPFGVDSVAGERGAFPAMNCADVGSPGYVVEAPPRFVKIVRQTGGVNLRWRAVPGRTYRLMWKGGLGEPGWNPLATRTATDWVETLLDTTAGQAGQRFYQLEENP